MAYNTFGSGYYNYLGNNNYYGGMGIYPPTYNQNQMPINQPQNSQMQQQSSYDIPIQGVIFLTSDEAKAYIVPPNKRVMIMDRDKSVFYIKSADALGQSNTTAYRFEAMVEQKPEVEVEGVKINTDDYVKKDEIKSFATTEDLEGLKEDFNKSLEDFKKTFMKKVLNNETK